MEFVSMLVKSNTTDRKDTGPYTRSTDVVDMYGSDEQKSNPTLQYGSDPTELFSDRSIREKNIEYNGKIWRFKYRELTWAQNGRITSKATKTLGEGDKVQVVFDIAEYGKQYLLETLVEAPFPINPASLLKLSDKFGRLLSDAFVDMPTLGEPESKNLDKSLQEGEETLPQ